MSVGGGGIRLRLHTFLRLDLSDASDHLSSQLSGAGDPERQLCSEV